MQTVNASNIVDKDVLASLGLVDNFGTTKVILQKNTEEVLEANSLNMQRINNIIRNINYERLRPKQKQGVRNVISMFYNNIYEGLAKMPTGTGKTTYFSEILCALGEPALVQVSRKGLVSQTMQELEESGYDRSQIFSLPIFVYDEKKKEYVEPTGNTSAAKNLEKILDTIEKNNIESPVIVSTYASLKSIFKNNKHLLERAKKLISTLVSDEAHHTTGEVATDMIEYLMEPEESQPHMFHIKLTATPDRKKVSLRDGTHMIIDVKYQECVEDGTLILPTFRGVGVAYLPHNQGEKAPTDTQIQNSGKYVDEYGRPVREVLIDAYIEDKKKIPYLPGAVFCGTIQEANDTAEYCKSRGLRAISVTSDDDITFEEVKRMVYNDQYDLIVTVAKVGEGFDTRPLRAVLRCNASRDPVYKTQGNGRISRTLRPEDVEYIFAVLRPKELYKGFSDEDLKKMIRKTHDDTFIYEPSKWVVASEFQPLQGGREGGERGSGGGSVQGKGMTILEELPNSIEELILCGELEYDYVLDKFPEISINIKDVVNALAECGISSMETFLCSHEGDVLKGKNTKLTATNQQKIRNIYAFRSLKEINKMSILLGFTPMSQDSFDTFFQQQFETYFQHKPLNEFYKKFRSREVRNGTYERYVFGYPVWKYKYGKNLETLQFDQVLKLIGKDVRDEIKSSLKDTTMTSLLNRQDSIFKEWMDIVNIARKEEGLSTFRSNSSASRVAEFMTYLGNILGLPSVKSELLGLLGKHNITTPQQFMNTNWDFMVHLLKEFDTPTMRSYIGIYAYGPLRDNTDAKKTLISFIWGAEVADGMIYEIVAKHYLPDITDGLEGVAKLSKVNAKEIGDLLGIKKVDMNTAFYQQIIAAALEGKREKESVMEEVKTARGMTARALQKKIAINKLKNNYDITDVKELAKKYTDKKEEIDKDMQESLGIHSIDVSDIIQGVYETTPQDTVRDELISLGKLKASVIFEEFDTIYPLIQDILTSVYSHVQPGDEDSIKDFISWLKLDLTTEAQESRKHIIDAMSLEDIADMGVFWKRPDVVKVIRYLYDQEAIDTASYQKEFFKKMPMNHLNAKKDKYLQGFGKTPLEILLNYEKIEKKDALWNFYQILYPSDKKHTVFNLETLEVLTTSAPSNEYLKDYLQQKGYDTLEKKRSFCSEKMKNSIWLYIFRKIVGAKEIDTEDDVLKAVMLSIAPSPREILITAFEKNGIRTKKDLDAFWKTYTAMKGTDTQRSQWTMRFGRFFFGPNFKDTGYIFNEDEYKRLKIELVNKSLLVS